MLEDVVAFEAFLPWLVDNHLLRVSSHGLLPGCLCLNLLEDQSYRPGLGSISSHFTLCTLCVVAQSCAALCKPTDCSPASSSVHGDPPGKTGVGCPPPG